MGDDNEDLHAGPLQDRIGHKNWKYRRAAYEDLKQLLETAIDGNVFDDYGRRFKEIVLDKNAAAQEAGLDALLVWIDRSEAPHRLLGLCGTICEKCFGGRPKTKTKAAEALLKFIEVTDNGEAVTEGLLEHVTNKQWKIASLAIQTLTQSIKCYGVKIIPVKPILKIVPELYNNNNKTCREDARDLVVELYRWLGAATKPTIDSLRPAQVKELEELFEKLPKERPKPERARRSEQSDDEEEGEEGGGGGEEAEEGEEAEDRPPDAFDFADPVDILSKIPADFEEGLASKKWKDRKEQMEALVSLADVVRLKPGDYRTIVRHIVKVVSKDANVIVVSKAVIAAGFLARGLRGDFSTDAKVLLPSLLAKLKEKKALVVNAINETLDYMLSGCFGLGDVLEEITEAMSDKVPQVKEKTMNFVERAILKGTRVGIGAHIKVLAPLIMSTMDDGNPQVRESAYSCFGALVGKVGDHPMTPYINKLDGIKANLAKEKFPEKIPKGPLPSNKEVSSKKKPASVRSGGSRKGGGGRGGRGRGRGGKRPSAGRGRVSRNPSTTSLSSSKSSSSATNKPSKLPAASTSATNNSASSNSNAQKKKAPAPAVQKPAPAPVVKKAPPKPVLLSLEEGLEKAASLFPAETLEQLTESQWKTRMAAVKKITEVVEGLLEEKDDAIVVQATMRQLEQAGSFKDANFQVLNNCYTLVTRLSKSDHFLPVFAELVLPSLAAKMADFKLRRQVVECLISISEAVGLPVVFPQIYEHAPSSKPKIMNEALEWVITAFEDFGVTQSGIDVKALVSWAKGGLECANPRVRNSAVKLVGKLSVYIGADAVREMVEGVNGALMSTIDKELDKWSKGKAEEPIRFKREPAKPEESEAEAETTTAESRPEDMFDDLLEDIKERVDISDQLTSELFSKMNSSNWRERQAALQGVLKILKEADMCIATNGVENLVSKLSARLKDSNKKLGLYTIRLLGVLSTAVGPEIASQMKQVIPLIFEGLTDNQKLIRDSISNTLDLWQVEVTMDAFIPYLPKPMTNENGLARKEALTWVVSHLEHFSKDSDLRSLLKPAFIDIMDKTPEVRRLGEAVLALLLDRLDLDMVRSACKTLKSPQRLQVVPVIKKLIAQNRANKENEAKERAKKEAEEKKKQEQAPKPAAPTPRRSAGTSKPTRETAPTPNPKATPNPKPNTNTKTPATAPKQQPTPAKNTEKPTEAPVSTSLSTPLGENDKKKERAEQDKHIGTESGTWAFGAEGPTPLHVQHLQHLMQPYVSPLLHSKLFSSDFRHHREAIHELTALLSSLDKEVVDNTDLLFKWCTLRLFDDNTSTQEKALDFLSQLFGFLEKKQFLLPDYEAALIIPVLITASGRGEAVCLRVRELLKFVPRVYPASKMFDFFVDSLSAKSPKTLTESLGQMANLIYKQGILVCSNPSKALPVVLAFITHRVPATRNAALTCLQQAHLNLGEDLWPLLGNLSSTEKALLEQKLSKEAESPDQLQTVPEPHNTQTPKSHLRSPKKAPKLKSSPALTTPTSKMTKRPTPKKSPRVHVPLEKMVSSPQLNTGVKKPKLTKNRSMRQAPKTFSLDIDKFEVQAAKITSSRNRINLEPTEHLKDVPPTPQIDTTLKHKSYVPRVNSQATIETPKRRERRSSRSSSRHGTQENIQAQLEEGVVSSLVSNFVKWSEIFQTGNTTEVVQTCAAVLESLDSLGDTPFVGSIQDLMVALAQRLDSAYSLSASKSEKARECKYLVNVALKLLHRSAIAAVLTRKASSCLYGVVFRAFADLDQRINEQQTSGPISASEAGLHKGLGLLIKTMLKNTDPSASFATLLENLDTTFKKWDEQSAQSVEEAKKLGAVVVKSFLLMIRMIQEPSIASSLDYTQLLYSIHLFFENHQQKYMQFLASRSSNSQNSDLLADETKTNLTSEAIKIIRSLISFLVRTKGRAISQHFGDIPVAQYPPPLLVRIINQTLKTMYAKTTDGQEATEGQSGKVCPSSVSSNSSLAFSVAGRKADQRIEDKHELVRIFRRLQESSGVAKVEALQQLHAFKNSHPDIDVQPYLKGTSDSFQAFVRRGLMSFNDKENNKPFNAIPPASSSFTNSASGVTPGSYLEKLRALQEKYGTGSTATSSSLLATAVSTNNNNNSNNSNGTTGAGSSLSNGGYSGLMNSEVLKASMSRYGLDPSQISKPASTSDLDLASSASSSSEGASFKEPAPSFAQQLSSASSLPSSSGSEALSLQQLKARLASFKAAANGS